MSEAEAAQRELSALQAEMRRCRRCMEAGFPVQGPAVFSGPASAQIMLIGQAPARVDIEQGSRPWSGAGGRRLMGWLVEAGFDEDAFRRSQYMAALTRCFPGKHPNGRGDRAPTRAERELCAPYLARELELIRPKLIIAVGRMAIEHFLGRGRLAKLIGNVYPLDRSAWERLGVNIPSLTWVVPLPHPSGASLWLNRPENHALVQRAVEQLEKLRVSLRL